MLPEALVIDHPEVDAQHEQIFIRIESLKIACFEGKHPAIEIFEDLLIFLGHHFATEERIAQEAGLEFSQHTKTHHDNLYLLSKALDEVRRKANDVYSFLRYVEYWFERHIIEEDKPFGAHLKSLSGNPRSL
jgi:hemerythrin-like metal-binding protein